MDNSAAISESRPASSNLGPSNANEQSNNNALEVSQSYKLQLSNDIHKAYTKAVVKFTSKSIFKFYFFLLIVLSISEPILVGISTTGISLTIQIWVLAISTALFFFGTVSTYLLMQDYSPFERFKVLLCGEVLGEVFCLGIGWAFIFSIPAVAALRCFRVFRLFWYLSKEPHLGKRSADYIPEEHWVSVRLICNLCVSYFTNLGQELFTAKSRGGLVVITLVFYTTYIFAVVFSAYYGYLETPEGQTCLTMRACFVTLLRLVLYDGKYKVMYMYNIIICICSTRNTLYAFIRARFRLFRSSDDHGSQRTLRSTTHRICDLHQFHAP